MCVCVLIQQHKQTNNNYYKINTHPLHTTPPTTNPYISKNFKSNNTNLYHIYQNN